MTEEGSAWYARAFIIKLKCDVNWRLERWEMFQLLLVRHQTQWVDLCHQDTGGDHVELDVDQEGTENIPDEGVSTQSSLQMEHYNITILRVKGIIEGHDMRDWLSS